MSLLGKVLAVLNVLAAAAFIWLVVADYSKRNAYAFSTQQADFMLNGLPLDAGELDVEQQKRAELVGKEMSNQLFSGVPGPKVKTQEEEIRQRYDSLRKEIGGEENDAAKRAKLEAVLIPLAHSALERAEWRQQILAAKPADLAEDGPLMGEGGIFAKAFQEALNGTNPADGSKLSPDQRRQAIASTLFSTSTKKEDYDRTLAVVGLNAYVRAVEGQATSFLSMIPEINRAIEQDRGEFLTRHRALVDEIVRLADRVRRLQEDLAKQEEQRNKYVALVADRQQDIQQLQAQIKGTQAATANALTVQDELEKALFEAQKTVAGTITANLKLEKDIKAQENGR
jgi:hypothetical protein